jgi:hypothetical protein
MRANIAINTKVKGEKRSTGSTTNRAGGGGKDVVETAAAKVVRPQAMPRNNINR